MDAEQDLLTSIFSAEAAYPWQPLAPAAEGYLANLEAEFDALDDADLSATIASGWQILESQITTLAAGEQLTTATGSPTTPVLDQLRQFQSRLPSGLLQSLASSATALARSGQPLIDQLVQCVNDLLPGWEAADLAVLARPLASSLRDGRGEIEALNLRALPAGSWETLSDLEQARLTLSIASVALKAVHAQDENGAEGSSSPLD